MIVKAVLRVLSIQPTDFPKAPAGQPPNETVTYFDGEVARDPESVTVPMERGIPVDRRPSGFGELVTATLQVEQVERVVKRQDREDAGRTYDSAVKQFKVKVLDFEPPPKAAAKSEPAKAAA
jgi:hypothetical protein